MASRDYLKEAEQETLQRKLQKAWIQERVEAIRARVSAYDVLRRNGVKLRTAGDDRAEQISCPFHGKDTKPSAKVFPTSSKGSSHVWCYVCQEHWDAISLWRKFTDETTPFTRTLTEIELAYGLKTPDRPNITNMREAVRNQEVTDLRSLLNVVERRLLLSRDFFEMKPYLTLGSVLDRLHYRLDHGQLQAELIRTTAHKVLEKIGARCRDVS